MRKSLLFLLLMMGFVVAAGPAKAKKEAPPSKLFCQARYVYVQTYEGDPDAQIAREYPQDYDAAVAVQQTLKRWGRYMLVYQQQNADLVFVVWKERKGGNRLPGQPTGMPPVTGPHVPDPGTQGPGAGGPGNNPQGGSGQNPGGIDGPDGVGVGHSGSGQPLDGRVGPPGDLLAVYEPPGNKSLHSPIWKRSRGPAW